MKKKVLLTILAGVMALSLVACGNNDAAEADALKDGKYEVEVAADEKGNASSLTIEVKDGKIATAKYDEVNVETQVSKLDNPEYNEKMKSVSGTNPIEAFPQLEKSLVEKQSADVDTVTGATSTTATFKAAAEKALENAKAGNTEKATIEVAK